jgi:hypothetical protein
LLKFNEGDIGPWVESVCVIGVEPIGIDIDWRDTALPRTRVIRAHSWSEHADCGRRERRVVGDSGHTVSCREDPSSGDDTSRAVVLIAVGFTTQNSD